MASAQAFMTYWMLRLLVKPQIARRWGSQSLDEQRRGYERTAQRWGVASAEGEWRLIVVRESS
jgi:hypothetical protein